MFATSSASTADSLSDLDEYLPHAMLDLCDQILSSQGYTLPIDAGSTQEGTGERVHKLAYLSLRTALQQHASMSMEPELAESIRPTGARDWQPAAPLQHALSAGNETLVL